MKTVLPWIVVVAIAAGAFLLRFSFVYGSDSNWVSVGLPFPGRGFSVGERFAPSTGGQFNLEIVTPASAEERKLSNREQPPVLCDFTIVVTRPDGFRLRRSIN